MNPTTVAKTINPNKPPAPSNPKIHSTPTKPVQTPVSTATIYPTNGMTLIPYGWVYTPFATYQPIYYSPSFVPQAKYNQVSKPQPSSMYNNIPKSQTSQFDSRLVSKYAVPSYGFSTTVATTKPSLDFSMSLEDLYNNIKVKVKTQKKCKVTWLNRLFAKVNTVAEFEKALEIYILFQEYALEITSETGTLLIKAACRAGIPEKALAIVKDVERIRVWPTIGGVHYLMINFSLKKDTKAVFESFEIFKLRDIEPNARTFHILIRECVDNGLMEDALKYAKQCQGANITPNRVIVNILMNGCRKFNKPELILELRELMQQNNIEINDTTCKFTALAYMMLKEEDKAVKAFLEYPEMKEKQEEYCKKYFELEDQSQKAMVADLFETLNKKGVALPSVVNQLITSVKTPQQPSL